MIRKALCLIAPVAVLAAVALAPVSASAGRGGGGECPKGTNNSVYCEQHCVVPELRGLTVRQAEQALEEHDCDLGKVKTEQCKGEEGNGKGHEGNGDVNRNGATDNEEDKCEGVNPGLVLRSEPPAGTQLPADAKVDVVVREGDKKH